MNLSVSKQNYAEQVNVFLHVIKHKMSEDEVTHDLKQQSKLDKSANKIKAFLAMN